MLDLFRDQVAFVRFRTKLPKIKYLRPSPQTKCLLSQMGVRLSSTREQGRGHTDAAAYIPSPAPRYCCRKLVHNAGARRGKGLAADAFSVPPSNQCKGRGINLCNDSSCGMYRSKELPNSGRDGSWRCFVYSPVVVISEHHEIYSNRGVYQASPGRIASRVW
jgi:hypothetical protein